MVNGLKGQGHLPLAVQAVVGIMERWLGSAQ
jgi:hypothetical protein